MTVIPAAFGSNRLLNLLPEKHRKNFVSHCELVSLNIGEVLGEPGDSIAYVYFPVEGIISWEKQIFGSPFLLVTLIGNEGMLCISLLLSTDITPCRAVVQKAGFALRIPTAAFMQQIEQKTMLDILLKRYTYVTYNQVLQIAACNLFHQLESRLAKLLLMFQDRSQSAELHVTQKQLAKLLGVRRVGITRAAGALHRRNLISYSRGNIIIHDNNGLKALSCVCYETDKTNYENILRPQTTANTSIMPIQVSM